MQDAVGSAQNQQWLIILSQLSDVVWRGISTLLAWESYVFEQLLTGSFWAVVGKVLLLVPPTAVLVAGAWGTMFALFTLPFRLGRAGSLLNGLVMSWWDGLRMAWFYWA